MQAVDLLLQRHVRVALQPVRHQQHHGALPQNAAGPLLVERPQRGGDSGAAGPVLRRAGHSGKRGIRIAPAHGARHVGEPRAEQENVHPPLLRQSVQEMQDGTGIVRHGARDIHQSHHRRRPVAGRAEAGQHHLPARGEAGAQRRTHVEACSAGRGPEAARGRLIIRHGETGDAPARLRHFRRAHLGKVARAQNIFVRCRHPRIEGDLGRLHLTPPADAAEQRLLHPPQRRRMRSGLLRWGGRREHGDKSFRSATATPEDAEGLIEHLMVFMPAHEDGMKRPVQILTPANTRHIHR